MILVENDIIALRLPQTEDLDKFYTWENDPAGQICATAKYSRFELWQYLHNPIIEKETRFIIIDKANNEAIGYVENIDGIGIYIDRTRRNKGLGTAALTLFVQHLNKELYARIETTNLSSQRIFLKAGFKKAGVKDGIGLWTKGII